MIEKQKTVKYFNVFKCNRLFSILDVFGSVSFDGRYLRLKTSFSNRDFYVPEVILIYISLASKSKSHVNVWDEINSAKRKIERSVLIFQELLNLE